MGTSNSTTITIQLTKGQVALIDDIDADLARFKWTALSGGGANGFYAYRMSAGPHRVAILLHRVILERMIGRALTKTELTDHANGDKLDNRRENLRIATRAQNGQNRSKSIHNTSGFKGVNWHRGMGKWQVRIKVNGKRINLGYFDSPETAHAAYCEAAKKYHGEFANTGGNIGNE